MKKKGEEERILQIRNADVKNTCTHIEGRHKVRARVK